MYIVDLEIANKYISIYHTALRFMDHNWSQEEEEHSRLPETLKIIRIVQQNKLQFHFIWIIPYLFELLVK